VEAGPELGVQDEAEAGVEVAAAFAPVAEADLVAAAEVAAPSFAGDAQASPAECCGCRPTRAIESESLAPPAQPFDGKCSDSLLDMRRSGADWRSQCSIDDLLGGNFHSELQKRVL